MLLLNCWAVAGNSFWRFRRNHIRASPTTLSLRGRSRRELTWQSSRERYMGCRGRCGRCPMRSRDCRVGLTPSSQWQRVGRANGCIYSFQKFQYFSILRRAKILLICKKSCSVKNSPTIFIFKTLIINNLRNSLKKVAICMHYLTNFG